MNKYSRTARSVTFAAIVGVSLGMSSPIAIAQDEGNTTVTNPGDSPLVNKNAKGALTIHKFGTPVSEGQPSGTKEDLAKINAEKLEGVGFTVYKINKTADGSKNIDVKTNAGLLEASKLRAADFSNGAQLKQGLADGVLSKVADGTTNTDGQWEVSKGLELGAYLVVETGPKPGYTPAAPFIAFVPMTSNGTVGQEGQGSTWNYDVHAFPKNYKDEQPTKTVSDKDQNAGDKNLVYTVTGTARALRPGVERTQFWITDQLDPKLQITNVEAKILKKDGGEVPLQPVDVEGGKLFDGQNVNVKLTTAKAKELATGDKVVATITTTLKPQFKGATDIAPNTAKVYQNNPGGGENNTPVETPTVKTYWGGLQFKKVDSNRKGLEGAEFQIARVGAGKTCDSIDTSKNKTWTAVNGQQGDFTTNTFKSAADGTIQVTGLHVNDFENNQEVSEDQQSTYCLIETKAPKGKELLPNAVPFKLVAKTKQDGARTYELASVQVGSNAGEVVNSDDTTPNLPMTGGAGVGILAAIGAIIVAAGVWFARRSARN